MKKSLHAEVRINQRGLHNDKLRILLNDSCRVSHYSWVMTRRKAKLRISSLKRDIQDCRRRGSWEVISVLKREIQLTENLVGWKVVIKDNLIITCYPMGKGYHRKPRKLRRN